MVGHFEPEDLRGAEQQDGFDARCFRRKSLVEKTADNVPQRAEPAHHRGGEAPHQRAVAVGERRQAGMRGPAGELFVERDLPPQYAVENIGGNAPGGEARDIRLRGGARSRHERKHCHEMCPAREADGKKPRSHTALRANAGCSKSTEDQPKIVIARRRCTPDLTYRFWRGIKALTKWRAVMAKRQPKPVQQLTNAQFEAMFPDEDHCRGYLVARRWPLGVRCPRCGSEDVTELKGNPWHWQCYACAPETSYRFSHIAGTIYENTNKPLRDWFKVAHLMLTSKKGISSRQVGRYHGLWLGKNRLAYVQ